MREANARILYNRTRQFAKVTYDGFPSGCLNACSGSVVIQYSSSTSNKGSTSKLPLALVSEKNTAESRDLLLVVNRAWPTKTKARHTVQDDQSPDDRKVVSEIIIEVLMKMTHQKALFINSPSTVGVVLYTFLRWAPISCAKRSPNPITVQLP